MELTPFTLWLKNNFAVAWNLPTVHGEACSAIAEPAPGGDMPNATVYRIMVQLDVQYRAVLQTLVHPETSVACQSLTRSLIEGWAVIDYIWSDGSDGAACRALSTELGWVQDRKRMLDNLPEETLAEVDAQRTIVTSNLKDVEALRLEFQCTGGARTYGSVDGQVRTMSRRPGLDWLILMWRSQSETLHLGGAAWLYAEVEEGRNEIRYPSDAHRANWFQHATVVYYNAGLTALWILRRQKELAGKAGESYSSAFLALHHDADLRRLMSS
jgi:hypothetical protein